MSIACKLFFNSIFRVNAFNGSPVPELKKTLEILYSHRISDGQLQSSLVDSSLLQISC